MDWLEGMYSQPVFRTGSFTHLLFRAHPSIHATTRVPSLAACMKNNWERGLLRAPAVLDEGQVWFPLPTGSLTTALNSASRASNTLFWLPCAPGTHPVYIHACRQNVHTIKQKIIFIVKDEKSTLSTSRFFSAETPHPLCTNMSV